MRTETACGSCGGRVINCYGTLVNLCDCSQPHQPPPDPGPCRPAKKLNGKAVVWLCPCGRERRTAKVAPVVRCTCGRYEWAPRP